MGSVLGTAVGGIGGFVGNVVSSPFSSVVCERVCSGTWDLLCFIEHLCVASILKFILALILALIVLYVFYLLCKLGVVKCVAKNACKLVYMPCWGGCHVLHHLWRKVQNTERVYRGRRGQQQRRQQQQQQQPDDDDVELGNRDLSTSSYDVVDYRGSPSTSVASASDYSGYQHRGGGAVAVGRSLSRVESSASSSVAAARWRRKDRIRQSLRPRRAGSKVEHAMKISRESDSEQRRSFKKDSEQRRRHHPHHHPQSIAARKEEVSSLHHHGSPHQHPHSIGAKRKETPSLNDHGSVAHHRDHSHAHRRT